MPLNLSPPSERLQEFRAGFSYDPRALTVARQLQDLVAPAQVVLFGSRARGDWHDESDIDLMVIADSLSSEERRALTRLGRQLRQGTTTRLYGGPVYVQILSMTRAEFNRARRSRMHLAGGVQHDGLMAQGEPMPPVEQNEPWPAVQNFLQLSFEAMFHALRAEGDGGHKEAVLHSYHALELCLKAYISALGKAFPWKHDLTLLIGLIERDEQKVDFSALTSEWCDEMLELRRLGPYVAHIELFEDAADILDLVQQACGASAARTLELVGRQPAEVGYRFPVKVDYFDIHTDRPLGGLEDASSFEFAQERLEERGEVQGERRILLRMARRLYPTHQVDVLERQMNSTPPANWPSVEDLMDGKWSPDTNDTRVNAKSRDEGESEQ